jgi:hypothetical protein
MQTSEKWRWFLRWRKYGWPRKIKGLDGALGKYGFCLSFDGAGWFHNGSHWFYAFKFSKWDDEVEKMELEISEQYSDYLKENNNASL